MWPEVPTVAAFIHLLISISQKGVIATDMSKNKVTVAKNCMFFVHIRLAAHEIFQHCKPT